MGTLKAFKQKFKRKKIFILDRDNGECYYAIDKVTKNRLFKSLGDRFIEQLKNKGQWVWIILDRIPRMEDNIYGD